MRIPLTSSFRKAAFLGTSALLFLAVFALSTQALLEWKFSREATIEGLRRASRIQPMNASHHQALGSVYLHLDHQRAAAELERSVEINPHSAEAWLRLADAYSVLGYSDKQRNAILAALKAAPRDTSAQWQAANLFVAEGDLANGMRLMRQAVGSDANRAPAAMQIAYRLSDGNIVQVMSALPASASIQLQLMRWLVDRGHASDADIVWTEIMKSGQQFPSRDALFYVDSLLDRREVARACRAWKELASRDKEVARREEPGNVITNGDFEDNLLNSAFDWRYTPSAGVTVTIDTTTFHGGTRALSLQLDSGSLQDSGVYQLIPVEPDSQYSLQAFVRGEEIESANGTRIVVVDAYSNEVMLITDEAMGSFPWRETTGQFTTGHDSKLVRAGIGRSPAEGRIRGRLWVDDVKIERR